MQQNWFAPWLGWLYSALDIYSFMMLCGIITGAFAVTLQALLPLFCLMEIRRLWRYLRWWAGVPFPATEAWSITQLSDHGMCGSSTRSRIPNGHAGQLRMQLSTAGTVQFIRARLLPPVLRCFTTLAREPHVAVLTGPFVSIHLPVSSRLASLTF